MICANRETVKPEVLELCLARSVQGNTGKIEIFAFLHIPVEGIEDDEAVATGECFVDPGAPLDRSALAITEAADRGDSSWLDLLKAELLSGGFPKQCKCPSVEECEALGSKEDLEAALKKILKKIEGR